MNLISAALDLNVEKKPTSHTAQSLKSESVDIDLDLDSHRDTPAPSLAPPKIDHKNTQHPEVSISSFHDGDVATQKLVPPSVNEPIVLLNPSLVSVGPAPNRLPSSFREQSFEELCSSILFTGGNIDPIRVMPIQWARFNAPEQKIYQLVYGERRLRACIENKLPVKAIIGDITHSGTESLDRLLENMCRQELCPIEFARQVQHILKTDESMTLGRLAKKIGRDKSLLSRAVELAKVPDELILAFSAPQDIRYSDAPALNDAWNTNQDAVKAEAELIRSESIPIKAGEVVERLVQAADRASGMEGVAPCNTPHMELKVGADTVGKIDTKKDGKLLVQLSVPTNEKQRALLADILEKFVDRHVLKKSGAGRKKPSADAKEKSKAGPIALSNAGRAGKNIGGSSTNAVSMTSAGEAI